MIFNNFPKENTHTIVAGMGAAGIASAISLLIKGHNVTLIDKRAKYTLKQKVFIPNHVIESLKNNENIVCMPYIRKLENSNLTSLRKFHRCYLEILKNIYKKRYFIHQGKKHTIKGKLSLLQGSDKEIVAADGDSQTITLKNKTQLGFDYIIDATGSKHSIKDLITKENHYQIKFSSDMRAPEHTTNVVLAFKAVTVPNLVVPLNAANDYQLSDFSKNGWQLDRIPFYYLYAKIFKSKIYLLTEIPKTYLDEKDHNKIINFVKPILAKECKTNLDTLNVTKQDFKLFSIFDIKHQIADNPYTILGKNGALILVGDACCPADFHFGHGINKGIEDGFNLLNVFDEKGNFYPQALNKRTKSIREEFNIYSHELEQLKDLKKLKFSGFWYKVKFLCKELLTLESMKLAIKAALIISPFYYFISLKVPSLVMLRMGGAILGLTAFAYMKFIHFYANLSYKYTSYNWDKKKCAAHDYGIYSQQSLKSYIRGFFHKETYVNYYQYVEGSKEGRNRKKFRA